MKVQFTNDDLTEATVTKGMWWWKRRVIVVSPNKIGWYYAADGEWASDELICALVTAKSRVLRQREKSKDVARWSKP